MNYTLFFTLLISHIASAALPETTSYYFRWEPYTPEKSRIKVPAPNPISPQALSVSPPVALLPTTDEMINNSDSSHILPQALNAASKASSLPITPSPDRQIEPVLQENKRLANARKLTPSETQQSHFDKLLHEYHDPSKSTELRAEVFQDLQHLLNCEYDRLGQIHPTTKEQYSELQQQYDQLLMFCETVTTLSFFSADQLEKLRCYQVSMLIGVSNICGIRRENRAKIAYLKQALSIIENICQDVDDPYLIGQNFSALIMKNLCRTKIRSTEKYMSYDQRH
jgi:hypothetical protein